MFGIAENLSGLSTIGIVYLILTLVIFWGGVHLITSILPSYITGPVIMVIGVALAPTAVKMASEAGEFYSSSMALFVSLLPESLND